MCIRDRAKEVLADTDATQKEIDDAAAALDKAAEALESKGLPYVCLLYTSKW